MGSSPPPAWVSHSHKIQKKTRKYLREKSREVRLSTGELKDPQE